jgi:ribosomal-protein-alanine N-acetyltransferase
MSSLRIGLAQCRQTADFDTNAATVFRMLDAAARQRVQVLCFPETQTVGYRVDIATPEQPVPVDRLAELHGRVAERCAQLGMACVLGTETPLEADPRRGKPYNSALVISERGQTLGVHHKTRLTPLDALAYTPGHGFQTFELFGVRVGVVICFEGLRFADSTGECVRQGAQVIFHPQNNTTRPNDWKVPVHHAMIVTRAAENTVWFASCNACLIPHQNSRSLVVAPDGQIAAQTELRREELLVEDLDVARATRAMFEFDRGGMADVLFAGTVRPDEFATAGPMRS